MGQTDGQGPGHLASFGTEPQCELHTWVVAVEMLIAPFTEGGRKASPQGASRKSHTKQENNQARKTPSVQRNSWRKPTLDTQIGLGSRM